MNREDIIKWALESDPAGIDGRLYHMACVAPETLERFARLIAEDCAKRCEAVADEYQRAESLTFAELKTDAQTGAQDCVTAIREEYKP